MATHRDPRTLGKRLALIITLVVTLAVLLACSGSTATGGATHASGTPAPAKTVLTFSGNGEKKSGNFHVTGDWTLKWTCTNNSGIDGALLAAFIYPKGENKVYFDTVTYTCAKGKHSDSTQEHGGGDFYLSVIAGGISWTWTVVDIPDA
jgi:hypothetical protein